MSERDDILPADLDVRSFQIRGSRVHAHAPGLHGDQTDRWRVYYSESESEFPVKVVDGGATFDEALTVARKIAELFR